MLDDGRGSAPAVAPRVLVVDRSRLVAEAVAAAVGGPSATALSLHDLPPFMPHTGSAQPPVDVVVLDGDPDPARALAGLRGGFPGVPVVLLVSRWSADWSRLVSGYAVSAVVHRSEGLRVLASRVRAAMAGREAADHRAAAACRGRSALTSREREVGRLMAHGYSNRDIAAALAISVHTVRSHVSSILAKLGTPSRFAAAAVMRSQLRTAEVPDPPEYAAIAAR